MSVAIVAGALVIAFQAADIAGPRQVSGRFSCELTGAGFAGAAGAGIIGGEFLTLLIDTKERIISLNKLPGTISQAFGPDGSQQISWTWDVIRTDRLSLTRTDTHVLATLADRASGRQLEFCVGPLAGVRINSVALGKLNCVVSAFDPERTFVGQLL